MIRKTIPLLLLVFALCIPALCAENVTIDPAKAAQLRRLEPLSAAQVDVFVDAGQLTPAQAAFVKQCIGPGGKLNLPASAVGPEQPRPVGTDSQFPNSRKLVSVPTGSVPTGPTAPADIGLNATDQDHLARLIQNFRHGDRPEIGSELRKFRPAVNQLIAESYPDPIDLPVKIALWEKVAGPANPDAALGLFDTHRKVMELARPMLIPYAKDIGGAVVRRKQGLGDGPAQRVFTSRELRDMILDTEGLIAHCSGPSAAIFLMGVYGGRYTEGEAPMRDDGRDWRRLVEACGANPKHFDDDDPKTWDSRLSAAARAAIAEQLIPYLQRAKDDCRRIARKGLTICLGSVRHPDWDASRGEWERWWEEHGKGL